MYIVIGGYMARYDLERTEEGILCSVCGIHTAVEGTDLCARHGANKVLAKKAQENILEIKKDKLRARINVLASNPKRYTLDEELGVLRLTLEEKLNNIGENEIHMHSDGIATLVGQIQKLVDSCIKISRQLKLLMTPDDMNMVVQKLVDVLDDKIQDKDLMDEIANELLSTLDDVYSGREAVSEVH